MRIFFAVGVFFKFWRAVQSQKSSNDSQRYQNLRKFQKSEKNENNYQFLRCCFINPVHNWDNLSQLFCLSRLLNFVRPQNAPRCIAWDHRLETKNKNKYSNEKKREKNINGKCFSALFLHFVLYIQLFLGYFGTNFGTILKDSFRIRDFLSRSMSHRLWLMERLTIQGQWDVFPV